MAEARLNGKELMARADRGEGSVFPIGPGWKKALYFAGFLCCILIIGLPIGVWIILSARKNCLAINDEGFAMRWFTTRAWRWSEIEEFRRSSMNFHSAGGGLVGALVAGAARAAVEAKTKGLKGPIGFKVKGKRGWVQIPAHTLQNSALLAREMEVRTGLPIFQDAQQDVV